MPDIYDIYENTRKGLGYHASVPGVRELGKSRAARTTLLRINLRSWGL